ncbi:hypothetical protein [Plantibacter flavus]|nr:hypothetical protein [Plantibacter flavus]
MSGDPDPFWDSVSGLPAPVPARPAPSTSTPAPHDAQEPSA